VYMWLNKVTLDIIGLAGNLLSLLAASIAHSELHAGFNHAFDSLRSPAEEKEEKKSNDIYQAIRSVLAQSISPGPLFAIQLLFPMFRLIVSISLYQRGGGTDRTTHFSTANSSLSCCWSRFQRNSAHWIPTYPGQEDCRAR
jgi:hypothetical protein